MEIIRSEAADTAAGRARTCRICGARGRRWAHRGDRDLIRCPSCRFAWVPQGLLRTREGVSIYADERAVLFETQDDYYRDESAVDAARAKLAWVTEFARDGGQLLDVGANFGHFAREAQARFVTVGIEPSAPAVRWAQATLQAPVEVGSIDRRRPDFTGRFNAITLFDVIEHLEEPADALRRCREYLARGGRLFLTTPDSGSTVARIMGVRWHYFDLDQHISVFDERNLTRLLYQEGFRIVSKRTFGRRYRFSYIERRIGELAPGNAVLRAAHVAALPLRLWPEHRITINLHDVMGLVAEAR